MGDDSLQQIQPGQLIADRYRLEEPIGHGAMGAVWRALHVRLESPVAIKLLNSAIADDPEMLERFLREARSAAAVRSSHVVQIFDYGVDRDLPYIAMELLVGEPLDVRLDARGVLEAPELDKIFTEVARAVSNAHAQGVVHRDIKPANIFIAREGDLEVTKVLDFGIAKLLDQRLAAPVGSGTHTGNILGTPNYMSPEQARGQRHVDHRSDLWSLAVLAFECLTGRQPFESATLGDLVVKICTSAPLLPSQIASVPRAFDAWFLRGVNKEPSERFRSALEMADELHALLCAEGLGADSRQRSSTDRRFPPDRIDPARGAAHGRSSRPSGTALGPGAVENVATASEPPQWASREPTLLTSTGAIEVSEVSPAPAARPRRYAVVAGVLLVACAALVLGPGRTWFVASSPKATPLDEREAAGGRAADRAASTEAPASAVGGAAHASAPNATGAPAAPATAASAHDPSAEPRAAEEADAFGASPAAAAPSLRARANDAEPAEPAPASAPADARDAARAGARAANAARAASPARAPSKPRQPSPPRQPSASAASPTPPRLPKAAPVARPAPPQAPASPAVPTPAAPKPGAPFDPYSDRL